MGTMNNAMGGGMGGPGAGRYKCSAPGGEEVPSGGQPFDLPVGKTQLPLPMDGNVPERPQAPTPQQKADKIL